jgi:hypothetical protein
MSRLYIRYAALSLALWSIFGLSSTARAHGFFVASLRGFQEVPAISSVARGWFEARLMRNSTLEYELSYKDLQGQVTEAHIHFAQPDVNGGISVWLCTTSGVSAPAGTPTCPSSGTLNGRITAAEVVGPEAQGISPGEFDELLRAIRAGKTYVNVHSTLFPRGEIRGQIEDYRYW